MKYNIIIFVKNKLPERPGLLTEKQALAVIQPYLDGLMDDFRQGWRWVQEILDQDPERRATFDNSTVAGMIFNRCAVLFGKRLDGQKNIQVRKHGRMLRAIIDGQVALRFKKLKKQQNGHLCSGNIKTNTQSLIYWQLGFDQMADAKPTEITFGYTANDLNTDYTGLYLACPVSWYENKWISVLSGGEQDEMFRFTSPESPDGSTGQDQVMMAIESRRKKAAKAE